MTSALQTHLQSIYDQSGKLTPELVVDVAKDESHPLHHRFEWDDTIAGEKYRRSQASELIRSVEVVYKDKNTVTQRVRAFHAVTRIDGASYVPVTEVAENPDMQAMVLAAAEREWKTLKKKYAHLTEFLDLVSADLAAV